MSPTPRIQPEFARPIAADSVGSQAQHREIVADPAERAALARRFGFLSLDRLSATLELRRQAGEIIGLTGRLMGDVVQSCVVSLAPVPAHIEADFEASYAATAAAELPAVDLDPLDRDGPEPLIDGEIDLGEAVAQQLAIALDPYPRAPGAALPAGDFAGAGEQTGKKRPFAVLETLKKRP
jgi:uncharacterized metal-binding protein YceD (DUF177 family)